MYDQNYIPVGLPFEKDMIKLARFLRANFPAEVAENERKPLEQSGAVELAIELLTQYKSTCDAAVHHAVPVRIKRVCPQCKAECWPIVNGLEHFCPACGSSLGIVLRKR